jgi:hypothetical protein
MLLDMDALVLVQLSVVPSGQTSTRIQVDLALRATRLVDKTTSTHESFCQEINRLRSSIRKYS